MSAWPQAAWIVKKLQKNFDFSSEITYYTQNLNTLNGRVNTLNDVVAADADTISGLEGELADVEQQINQMSSTIRAVSVNGLPQGYTTNDYSKGTIWLVLKQ